MTVAAGPGLAALANAALAQGVAGPDPRAVTVLASPVSAVPAPLMLGAGIVALLALVIAGLVRFRPPREVAAIEAATGRPVSLVTPRTKTGDARLAAAVSRLCPLPGPAPRIVLLTSTLPGEGKTTTALHLARAEARAGRRTLLVDADLRRRRLSRRVGQRGPGLADSPESGERIEAAPVLDEVHGVDLLPAGRGAVTSGALKALPGILGAFEGRYDTVILDGPPLIAGQDAVDLAALADTVLYLVHARKTAPRRLRHQLARLEQAPVTLVLTHAAGELDIPRSLRDTVPAVPSRARPRDDPPVC